MNVYMVQKSEDDFDISNGGYHTPAESIKGNGLVIEKDGVVLRLNGSELAQLYNAIRIPGNSPLMSDPNSF